MLTESDLRELLGYQAKHPVLSVYINTEPSEGSADAYKLRLRSMLKDAHLMDEMPDDVAAIERYFATEYDWAGRSVVVFSCAHEGFFRVLHRVTFPQGFYLFSEPTSFGTSPKATLNASAATANCTARSRLS